MNSMTILGKKLGKVLVETDRVAAYSMSINAPADRSGSMRAEQHSPIGPVVHVALTFVVTSLCR